MSSNPKKPSPEVERCLQEQRECRDYILAGGSDTEGALRGMGDWVMEEILRADYSSKCAE